MKKFFLNNILKINMFFCFCFVNLILCKEDLIKKYKGNSPRIAIIFSIQDYPWSTYCADFSIPSNHKNGKINDIYKEYNNDLKDYPHNKKQFRYSKEFINFLEKKGYSVIEDQYNSKDIGLFKKIFGTYFVVIEKKSDNEKSDLKE
jgi:hypothetical protein